MVSAAQRTRMVEIATFLIAHAPQIHYAEVRPMSTARLTLPELQTRFRTGGTITMDCSEAVTLICRLAGLRDPNGLGYNGEGYTGTLLDHLPHYTDVARGHPGALLVFGAGTGTHVCMVLERDGENPILFSHGSEIGPLRISLADERTAHEGEPITMLDITHL